MNHEAKLQRVRLRKDRSVFDFWSDEILHTIASDSLVNVFKKSVLSM